MPEISSLCASLALSAGSCAGYVAADDARFYVYRLTSQRQDITTLRSITLDQVLCGKGETKLPAPTRSQRYALSLTIASSFLQLLDSPWLPSTTALNKANVHFSGALNDGGEFYLDQPHITCDLRRNDHSQSSPSSYSIQPNQNLSRNAGNSTGISTMSSSNYAFIDALDHLGILLLELCFGRPLESQPSRMSWPIGATPQQKAVFDIMAARTWQCEVLQEAGADYAEAVAWCLGGNRSTPAERWRTELLRRVVEPLQRCRDYIVHGGWPGGRFANNTT